MGSTPFDGRRTRDETEGAVRKRRQEFKALLPVRLAVLLAAVIWFGVTVVTFWLDSVPATTPLIALAFLLFFLGYTAHFWSMRYVVDEYGVTCLGATEFEHYPWEDIIQVRDADLPLGGWVVTTRRGGFIVSSFVARLDRLVDVIVARAGLFRT